MTAITLINKLAKTGLTIKQAIIIAERAEAIEAAAMKIRREAVGAKTDIDLNLAATDISEFWRQANELVRGANNV